MNNIKIFTNPEFGEIRTVIIDGEPWFVGIEVAKALGYAVPRTATAKHVDKEDRLSTQIEYAGQNRDIIVINESGLYSLIFGSKLESAKKFKKWVTSEVLPTIRKTGQYGQQRIPMTIPEQIQCIAQGHVGLKAEIDSVKQDLEEFKHDMPLLAVECDRITTAVHKRGVSALGGKESNAYKDSSLRGKVYQDIHRELKRQFGVSTYKAIKRSQCDLAVSIVEEYELPIVLEEQIRDCNAQMNMGVA